MGLEALVVHTLHAGVECFIVSVYIQLSAEVGASLGKLPNLAADSPCLFCGFFSLHHAVWKSQFGRTPSFHSNIFSVKRLVTVLFCFSEQTWHIY